MLALSPDCNLIDELWKDAVSVAVLPASMRPQFFAKTGHLPVYHENQRAFHRHYLRRKAILKWREKMFGVFTKDISRQGIGLLSPVQLLPLEYVTLLLSSESSLQLKIARCRRIEKDCFDIGARFSAPENLTKSDRS
jgi:PilZ domain